jgi:transcriptional regulator with XRE-family HTH domain
MLELEHIKIDPLKLRAARGDRKLIDVARAIGVSKRSLWNYENGHNEMPAATAAKLCILYKISIETLTTADEVFLKTEYSAV